MNTSSYERILDFHPGVLLPGIQVFRPYKSTTQLRSRITEGMASGVAGLDDGKIFRLQGKVVEELFRARIGLVLPGSAEVSFTRWVCWVGHVIDHPLRRD
jgi:hypothetical protein